MPSVRKLIGIRDVETLQPGEILWDSKVTGFCARRQKGPAISYALFYRTAGRKQKWATIGRHGAPWTPTTARAEALRLLGEVVTGGDPAGDKQAARAALTVAELCDAYLKDLEAGRIMTRRGHVKKPSTVTTDRSRIGAHIRPLLGSLKVGDVTPEDVERFMHDIAAGKTASRKKTGKARGLSNVRGGQGAASRTVGLLGALFSYAVRKRLRADNPVHGVIRFADGRRERRLSDSEYAAFGRALARAEQDVWPAAVAAARFLLLTGWRSGEALSLKWTELDLPRRTATPDTKTGRSTRPLSQAACDVLAAMPSSSDYVFPATRGVGVMSGFPSLFRKITSLGELPADVTPHVLRHSFASLAADLGFSEPTIAALIGHKGQSITSRYVHSADAVLLAAADSIAQEIRGRCGAANGH